MYAKGHRSHCRRNWVHRSRAHGEPQGTSWSFWGVIALFSPYSVAHQSKLRGKIEGKKKENRQKERRRKMQKETKGREEKEKKMKEKRPKDRIVPW